MISGLLSAIGDLAVRALNAIIAALGAGLTAAVAALPDMPAIPTMPSEFTTAASWVAWAFPVGTVVAALTFTLTVWLAWQLVAIALRWAKAI